MSEVDNRDLPSSLLRREHQVILRVVRVLGYLVAKSERGEGLEIDSLDQCAVFFALYADACHHAKEEDLLFPLLESRGMPVTSGPIGVMLQEHTVARKCTRQMRDALESVQRGDAAGEKVFQEAAREYADLLSNHIGKEDNILYPMGDHLLTADDQESLLGKFRDVQGRLFGGKRREELEQMADELERRWPGAEETPSSLS